jgi:hypothetical protein
MTRLSIIMLLIVCASCHDDEVRGCGDPMASNYNAAVTLNDKCSCIYDGAYQCGITSPSQLVIQPVRQETNVWCWLAVGEMIFKYYSLPNLNPGLDYQCGIVGAVGYSIGGSCDVCNISCANCIRPAGSNEMISRMLTVYPKLACKTLFQTNQTLKNQFATNFLAQNLVLSELTAKRPIIAGINPGMQFVLPGGSQHVALIVGYHFAGSNFILHVNDPFPYFTTGFDPYVASGGTNNGNLSYQIPYLNFVTGLKWNTSWFNLGY